MTKEEAYSSMVLFRKQMEKYRFNLYTPNEPILHGDTPMCMFKYFNQKDEAVACFSFYDWSNHDNNDNIEWFVTLHFGYSRVETYEKRILDLIIQSLTGDEK